ncbi:MAG TPA: ROK family protein [Bryobacteraceae bacterium]|nr:ROK family protein [Bryobacteraceae bacterium]
MHVVGLDVGGTKIAGGVVEFPGGGVRWLRAIPTRPSRSGQAVLDDALSLARELMAEAEQSGGPVSGIGVGVAETVDPAGNITSDQTIGWRGMPVQQAFRSLAPALVESDVRAAAFGEATFGAGQPYRLFLYITVGTGISYSKVQDGRPFAGARGNALVFASAPLTTRCTACGTVLRPVLEEFASGPALVARYNERAQNAAAAGQDVTGRAAAGDALATEIVRTAAEALGVSVAWLINSLDPEAVVVGGGLGVAGGLYWDRFVASTRAHIWAENARDLPVTKALLGADAGVVGAAAAWAASCAGRSSQGV